MKPQIVNPLVAKFAEEVKKRGKSLEWLCTEAGLDRGALAKVNSRGPRASMNHSSLERLCKVLGMDVSDLAKPPEHASSLNLADHNIRGETRSAKVKGLTSRLGPRDLPIKGSAAGAVSANGFTLSDDIIDYATRPVALAGIDDAYALYVVAESMAPLHRPGDLCCIHPGRPCLAGDSVIILVQVAENGPIEAYIKTLVSVTSDWIVTKQYNPPGEVKFKRTTVLRMHHVMTMREMLGV